MLKLAVNTSLSALADHLVRDGLLDLTQAGKLSKKARELNMPFICYLVKNSLLSSEIILQYCADKFSLPIFDLAQHQPHASYRELIKSDLIHRYHFVPLCKTKQSLDIAIADPSDHTTLTAIAFHTSMSLRPFLVAEDQLDHYIHEHYYLNQLESQLESTLSKLHFIEEAAPSDIPEENDEPIIKFVDQLLQDAIEKRSSDIHLEPGEQDCRIRFRIDGMLSEVTSLPMQMAARVITRLKIMANLNIAEKRLPQDGRITFYHHRKINIRINTCPTIFAEKIVLRILNTDVKQLTIDELGLLAKQREILLHALKAPQGLILVTGPTGSGKTLTLYSVLQYLNQIEKNISSVEDPVEIELPGITQVSINQKIGLDFAEILRAFLRQDPDIIMIGEIRDRETAQIAVQAAQTGHLVLSTLHSKQVAETVSRLQSIGVTDDQLTHSVSLIIAQRLVRKLCDHCKLAHKLELASQQINAYQAQGCLQCYQGYAGRTAIFELLPMSEEIKQQILTGQIDLAQKGYDSLWQAGLEKVKAGITSYTELIRMIGASE